MLEEFCEDRVRVKSTLMTFCLYAFVVAAFAMAWTADSLMSAEALVFVVFLLGAVWMQCWKIEVSECGIHRTIHIGVRKTVLYHEETIWPWGGIVKVSGANISGVWRYLSPINMLFIRGQCGPVGEKPVFVKQVGFTPSMDEFTFVLEQIAQRVDANKLDDEVRSRMSEEGIKIPSST